MDDAETNISSNSTITRTTITTTTTTSTVTTASTTPASTLSTTKPAACDEAEEVSEQMILSSCQTGDVALLRLWHSQGVCVLFSGEPLVQAAQSNMRDVVKY
jgi:hypothetical protein